MKLTKEEIKSINDFLIGQKIKYLDLRSELIDHLATEFEEKSNYNLIEDYLITKVNFIKDFAKKQQKAIHWSYQKQLWVQFTKFFYKPKFILFLFILVALGYMLFLILYPLFYQIKYSKAVKKVQSMQSLFTITALPSVFLYAFNPFKDVLLENPLFLIYYYSFSILLGLSAVIIIENDRKKILEKYHQLVNKE
jgi:hypothetical protein